MLLLNNINDDEVREMFSGIKIDDPVRVARPDGDYYHWEPPMDHMLGEITKVLSRDDFGFVLRCKDGRTRVFSFRSLELTEYTVKKMGVYNVGKYTYKLLYSMPLRHLRHVVLGQDYKTLQSIFGTNKLNLAGSKFKKIKEQCPRVIGALFSQGVLIRKLNDSPKT